MEAMVSRESAETRRKKPPESAETRRKKSKSAVTNGRRLFVEAIDRADSPWGRRFRDVFLQIIDDITPTEGLTEGQRQLARRAATLSIACEQVECRAAAGQDIDLETYGKLTDRLGRAFQRLGLKRQKSGQLTFTDLRRLDLLQQQQTEEEQREPSS